MTGSRVHTHDLGAVLPGRLAHLLRAQLAGNKVHQVVVTDTNRTVSLANCRQHITHDMT